MGHFGSRHFVAPVVLPSPEDVRAGVSYGAGGTEFTGTAAVIEYGIPVVPETAGDIIENIRSTLVGATYEGSPLFTRVVIVDDTQSFLHVDDPLSVPLGMSCGIVAGTVNEGSGSDDTENAVCHMPIVVVLRFRHDRPPGGGEQTPIARLSMAGELTKQALMLDPSRGGLTHLAVWNGSPINGTSVRGDIRPLSMGPDAGFYAATVGAEVVWCKLS